MKKIDTSNITGDVKSPIVKRTLEFYNEAIAEGIEDLVKALYGSYTADDLVILHGCEVTANIGTTSSVTEGAIYYNGEVYRVDANASINSPSNTLVWSISNSFDAGDPVLYSDSTGYNQHKVSKMVLSNAVSGSGLADYNGSEIKYLHKLYNKAEQSDLDTTNSVKADKNQGSYTTISLLNGWTAVQTLQYLVDQFGYVHIKGAINGASATNPQIAVIDSGARPQYNLTFPVSAADSSVVFSFAHLDIGRSSLGIANMSEYGIDKNYYINIRYKH
jgi:hypothetical protein